jgi:5-methyltetrahydrofolate--homocysteine methyltransferase
MSIKEDLKNAIIEIKYDEIDGLVKKALASGMRPLEILNALRRGLNVVGDMYQKEGLFLSELFLAAETMKNALEILQPLLGEDESGESLGTIVMGSIEGDIHDFGKIIVSSLMMAAGFKVVDIGVDVPAEKFVDEAEKVGADVIGVSALLSTTQPSSKKVVDLLKSRKIRDRYKVIVGGTGVVPIIAVKEFGVDAGVNDGVEGVKIIKKWLEKKRRNS